MTADIEKLAGMLEGISTTLTAFGEPHWANWLAEDARRLRGGDLAAIDHFLGAFGGMGSINDLYICPQNGHRVTQAQAPAANDRLSAALAAAWELARILASPERPR